jgi:hypothetical protein
MRCHFRLIIFTLLFGLFSACKKDVNEIRFVNDSSRNLTQVSVGPAELGAVPANTQSGYVSINLGQNKVHAGGPGGYIDTTITLSHSGTHSYSLKLASDFKLFLTVDK